MRFVNKDSTTEGARTEGTTTYMGCLWDQIEMRYSRDGPTRREGESDEFGANQFSCRPLSATHVSSSPPLFPCYPCSTEVREPFIGVKLLPVQDAMVVLRKTASAALNYITRCGTPDEVRPASAFFDNN